MTKLIATLVLVLFSLTVFSQTIDSTAFLQMQQKIEQLQIDLENQKKDLKNQQWSFTKKLSVATDSIQLLHSEIAIERKKIAALADSLGVQIINNQTSATQQIQSVQKTVNKNTLYWIIAVFVIALLSLALFEVLRRKQKSNKTDIEERLVKEYSKQVEVIESLLKTLRELPVTATNGEPDHSLALKLADEITLMERNISHMNQDTKGLKPLIRAIERLKDNLNSNGYEFVELLGKQYNEGMRIAIVSSIPDENVKKGVDIITKVIKPQVNYQDKVVQMAQVEVTVGVNE